MNDAHAQRHTDAKNPLPLLGLIAACVVLAIIALVLGVKAHHLNAKLADTDKQLTQAKADGAQAQSELDKAKSEAADLKTQLSKAKGQVTDLQSQLDVGKDASKDLQAQIDKAKAQAADQQAQLDKSRSQSTDLEAQLHQANAGSTQLLSQLDQAKIQSMDLQTRLQKAESDIAQLQPMLLKARHMPVSTSFDKEKWGRGVTLHVNNLNQQPLTVNITVTGSEKTRTQSNVVGAGATLNIEKLATGDTVTIASDGFETVSVTAQ